PFWLKPVSSPLVAICLRSWPARVQLLEKMARAGSPLEGDPFVKRRSRAERTAARRRAVAAADSGLAAAMARVQELEKAFDMLVGDAGVADRVRALLPALSAMVRGVEPAWLDRLRRNVALHAAAQGVESLATADLRTLRTAQRGPRLGPAALEGASPRQRRPPSAGGEAAAPTDGGGLRAEAAVFVPAGSCEPLGMRCTCGAAVFSDFGGPPCGFPRCTGTPREPMYNVEGERIFEVPITPLACSAPPPEQEGQSLRDAAAVEGCAPPHAASGGAKTSG
ncbi:unnamed protein product, partial [Prorocentrum cordatum]